MSIRIHLQEWQTVSFKDYQQLARLRLPEDEATQRLIQELSDSKKLIISQSQRGLKLETTSYVGQIFLGDLQVSIEPKIKMLPLLLLLRYAYDLRHLELLTFTDFDLEALTFQDLLIYQLVSEVNELLTRGLRRRYERRPEQLAIPRGSITFQTLARRTTGAIEATLPCVYYTRLEDYLLNQVLLQGIRLAIRLTTCEPLRTRLQRLASAHLAHISMIHLNQHVLGRVHRELNRLTATYRPSITLIEMLLASEGISFAQDEGQLSLPGFLFDMNRFFQELLARFLGGYLPGYNLYSQFEITDLFAYTDNPQRRYPPKLRPDYVVKKEGQITAVLDAKYRDLWEHDLPPEMLYQLTMYALSQPQCRQAIILYPTTRQHPQEARIEVRLPDYKASVVLRPVNLLTLADLVGGLSKNERACVAFASTLVFGKV